MSGVGPLLTHCLNKAMSFLMQIGMFNNETSTAIRENFCGYIT